MLYEEVEKYARLSGDKNALDTPVSRIGGYLDGYDKGIEKLDKVRAEITNCLKALDEIEKFNIYLPNEISGRRLTYQQCLEFIDKYKAEIEPQK